MSPAQVLHGLPYICCDRRKMDGPTKLSMRHLMFQMPLAPSLEIRAKASRARPPHAVSDLRSKLRSAVQHQCQIIFPVENIRSRQKELRTFESPEMTPSEPPVSDCFADGRSPTNDWKWRTQRVESHRGSVATPETNKPLFDMNSLASQTQLQFPIVSKLTARCKRASESIRHLGRVTAMAQADLTIRGAVASCFALLSI